jgi:hypothetical protein
MRVPSTYRFASCDDKSPHLLLHNLSGHVVHGANDTLHMEDSLVKKYATFLWRTAGESTACVI